MKERRTLCSVCRDATSDNPPTLATSPQGSKRYICDKCALLAKRASLGTDYDDIVEAMGELSMRLVRFNIGDVTTVDAVGSLIDRASKRAAEIKDGTYDFSQDPSPSAEDSDTPAAEEPGTDRRNDEPQTGLRRADKIINIASIGILAAALVGCIAYIIFFR